MLEIDIDKSIKRKRVSYTWEKDIPVMILFYFATCFLSFLPLICTLLVFFIDKRQHRQLSAPNYIIFGIIDIWMITGFFIENKLQVVKGKNGIENKEAILSALNDQYPDMNFNIEKPLLIRGQKDLGSSRYRIITVIVSEKEIYINFLNTFRSGIFSSFQALHNHFRSKKLAAAFEARIFEYNVKHIH